MAQESQAAFVLTTEINPQKCPLPCKTTVCVRAEAADVLSGRKMQKQRAYREEEGVWGLRQRDFSHLQETLHELRHPQGELRWWQIFHF